MMEYLELLDKNMYQIFEVTKKIVIFGLFNYLCLKQYRNSVSVIY